MFYIISIAYGANFIIVVAVVIIFFFLARFQALEEMAKKNNGRIICPRTGLVCSDTELVKAYIS